MASGEGQSEVLCDTTIIDVTESAGFRFSIALAEMSSIPVDKLYSGADIDTFLLACKPLHQFGKLLPQYAKDVDALKTFASYMSKTHQVRISHSVCTPTYTRTNSSHSSLCQRIVPSRDLSSFFLHQTRIFVSDFAFRQTCRNLIPS